MATFEEQVEALTSLTISSSGTIPTQAQLTQFIQDGFQDVIKRWIAVKPADAYLFQRITSEGETQAAITVGSGKVLNVVRMAGSSTDWRDCRRIGADLQSRVTDTDSIHYASVYNPAFFISEGGSVYVYPVPDTSGNNSYKAYYINAEPLESTPDDGTTLDISSTAIKNFPDDIEHLVPLYAAIKSLEAKIAEFSITEEDTELVQSLAPALSSLKEDYTMAFAFHMPKQQKAAS